MTIKVQKQLRQLALVFATAATFMTGCTSRTDEAESSPAIEECVQTYDTAAFQQKFPELYANFQKIDALPYSGHAIAAHLKDPNNNISSCVANNLPGNADGDFLPENGKLRVRIDHADPRAYTHEVFHAEQYLNGTFNRMGTHAFTIEDNIAGNMLVEASAVGYSFVAYKEMSKTDSAAYTNFTDSWYSFGMRPYFDSAYDNALATNSNLPPEMREKKALEAGGKAVVEGLMNGANKKWAFNYAVNSAQNNLGSGGPEARERQGYDAERTDFYRKAGAISNDINITPDKLLAPHPEKDITTYLAKAGIVVAYEVR
jgi:hypothetical protein